jgi:hypothetical protein
MLADPWNFCFEATGVILWFLARISSHPEVQSRAHAELDSVIGREYWPTAEDEQSLPYIRAIIKEVCPSKKETLDFLSHVYPRWSAYTHRSGWRLRTILQRTLCTRECTFLRTRPSFSTSTIFIITRKNIPTRLSDSSNAVRT